LKIKNLILVALFAALTAIGAFIKIPMPIAPITLQTLVSILAGMLLGPWLGALSQIVYVAVGLIGVPVFAGGGGIGYILQPSFGYLIGLVAGAFICGMVANRIKKLKFYWALAASAAGMLAVYLIGVPYLYMIQNLYQSKGISFTNVLYYGLVLFIPGDILKCIVASIITIKLKPIIAKVDRAKE
jgi:biotin transport system substrate-specific component